MKERFIENGIEYVRNGDYYIPNLKAPEGSYNIGKYGRLHSIFIKENPLTVYSMKMLNGTWLAYLEEIDTTAKEMIDKLIKDMAFKQGIIEELKAKDQMAWIGAMNNIRHSAEEFVLRDFVYSMEVQKLGFQVTSFTRKSRRYNSYKGNVGKIAPNRISRRFNTSVPHQKITTDTTEFKYYEIDNKGRMAIKKLYLDPFLDMFNGEILSYNISQTPSAIGILSAQNKAIEITADCPYRRTFHSDRGWAYQMSAYSCALKENKIFQSMSRKGNCYDNSVMENFFGILKQEMYYGTTYYSFEELKDDIERYIKYYNEKRIKEKLGWMSPVQYRLNTLAA